ncbi:MAG: RNA pyrophosphohydrolase [Pseudomonadota bacterium]
MAVLTEDQIAALPYRPCVGVMLVNRSGRVFVGQRRDSSTDAWQMPQGGIDPGEAAGVAARRELWEETGVTADLVTEVARTHAPVRYDLPADLIPKLWKGRYRGQEQVWFLFRFLGSDADVNIETEHPEFSRWQWLDPAELPARIVPFKRKVYETVLEAFADHLR